MENHNHILSPFTLNYLDNDIEKVYRIHSREYTYQILSFLNSYMILASLITLFKNMYFINWFNVIRTASVGIFIFVMVVFVKKFERKNKMHMEIFFCLIVIFIYFIHLKFFFPPLFEYLSNRNLFYLSSALESFRIFLFISKIKWIYVCMTNLILNSMQYYLILNHEIENMNIFSIIFTFVLMNTLPIIAFLQERSFKMLFYQNITFDRSLKCFEELITKILPNQIIILNESKSKILFYNEEVQKFYLSDNEKYLFQQIKSINISNSSLLSMLNNQELRNEKFSFLNYQTSIYNKKINQEYFFDVKLGRIQWQNEKAFLILLSDISAVKLVKKLQDLDAYKDRLLATVSHDLRTPINGLVGILEILYTRIMEKELRKYIKIATRCSNLLLFMINDILDFSQINNGKLRLLFSKYHVADLIKEVISLVKFQCQRKNIDFLLEIPKELRNQLLNCDYRRVQQVLLNLISNSLKFTNKGYIKLTITKIILHNQRFIQFSVEDTGIGIKESDKSKLFQLFGKLELDNPNINKIGVGLGLVISKHLVQLLSGDPNAEIEVESKYEKGSRFKFKLPLDIPEDEEINDEIFEKEETISDTFKLYKSTINSPNLKFLEESTSYPSSCMSKNSLSQHFNKVLVVDDDQINLFVIGKYLETFGIKFQTASDGQMAVEMVLREKNYTLILMDCNMPIMNGFDAAKNIKQLAYQKLIDDIPILALTANTTNKDIILCQESGMNDYLIKPVSKQQMKEKLQQILKIRVNERSNKIFLKENF